MTIFYIQWPSSNISTHINGWCVFILHISFLFCPHCVGRSNRYDSFIWITMDIPLFILSSCPTPYIFPFFLYISITTAWHLTMPWLPDLWLVLQCTSAPSRLAVSPHHPSRRWPRRRWRRRPGDRERRRYETKKNFPCTAQTHGGALWGTSGQDFVVTGKWVGKKNCWMVDVFSKLLIFVVRNGQNTI